MKMYDKEGNLKRSISKQEAEHGLYSAVMVGALDEDALPFKPENISYEVNVYENTEYDSGLIGTWSMDKDEVTEYLLKLYRIGLEEGCNIASQFDNERMNYSKIIQQGGATIVFFDDGEKVVSKCSENDIYDPTMGLYVTLLKKVLTKKQYDELMRVTDILEAMPEKPLVIEKVGNLGNLGWKSKVLSET